MQTHIKVYEDGYRDSQFYNVVGKLALDRNITKELHDLQYGAIYDEPHAVWFIMYTDTNEVVGVAALFDKPKEIFLDHNYIHPKFRSQGLGQQLFKYRLDYAESICNKRPIKAITQNEVQFHIYQKYGLELTSKRGKYYWVRKDVMK